MGHFRVSLFIQICKNQSPTVVVKCVDVGRCILLLEVIVVETSNWVGRVRMAAIIRMRYGCIREGHGSLGSFIVTDGGRSTLFG